MPTPEPNTTASASIHDASAQTMGTLEVRINSAGEDLLQGLTKVLSQIPDTDAGPQQLAKALGIDKVLASRILKALRAPDPMSVVHRVPGPEPMRRLLKASSKLGVDPQDLINANSAVDRFETLIRSEIGDRSALEAILSAWVPEARREFEMRRKQTAFRAMSQLKGAQADVYAEAAIFYPSPDNEHIDIVWIKAVIGLHRLRPGVRVKFTSRRQIEDQTGRKTYTLAGEPVDSISSATLAQYCSTPTPTLEAHHAGEAMHYLLQDLDFGASSSVDLVTCEVNRAEIPRYIPDSKNRKAWASSDINIPSKRMQFDVLVHQDLYNRSFPELKIYDTTINGQADINDPSRDMDQLDLLESIENLGTGTTRFGSSLVPKYRKMIEEVCATLSFDPSLLRGYRCTADYPIHGSQTAMVFSTQQRP